MSQKRIYLDYNATTPMHPEVLEAMTPFLKETFGNPSSVHAFGREARYGLEVAREKIANFIGAEPEEILFTSGGTEANNLAIKGIFQKKIYEGDHIITCAIEHSSVLRTCQDLEKQGAQVTYLPVDESGLVDPKKVEDAITDQTILITIMHANNETGSIQPIANIGEIARQKDIPFLTDAVQSLGKIPVNVKDLNVGMLSASGHKISGPKGTGFLYKKKGIDLYPQIFGGSHERNMRAGTENLPAIVGLGKAVELLSKNLEGKNRVIQKLRDFFESELQKNFPEVVILGNHENRLPNTSGICFPNLDGSSIMRNLDLEGIAVSTGSACMSGTVQTSHVLEAMQIPKNIAMGAIRFSFGHENTKEEIEQVTGSLQKALSKISQL